MSSESWKQPLIEEGEKCLVLLRSTLETKNFEQDFN